MAPVWLSLTAFGTCVRLVPVGTCVIKLGRGDLASPDQVSSNHTILFRPTTRPSLQKPLRNRFRLIDAMSLAARVDRQTGRYCKTLKTNSKKTY
eukprot:1701165-Amphidinium_carterae.1